MFLKRLLVFTDGLQFKDKMRELQVLLSQAVLMGYSTLTEEAIEFCNSFFLDFQAKNPEVVAGMNGVQYISGYIGVYKAF